MIKEAIATGSTIDAAKEAAVLLLGAREDDNIEFEIIDLPQKKSFGLFGGAAAKVRAYIELPDEKEVQAPAVVEKKEFKAKPEKKAEQKKESKVPLSPANTDAAETYLLAVLKQLGVTDITLSKKKTESGTEFDIEAEGLGIVIGRRGDTLEALQHLVSLVANKGEADYNRITINPGNYREKREGTLQSIARRSAQQAIKYGKNVVLEPMNSYERRIIHTAVQEINGASSWSIGENENRRVCIGTPRKDRPGYEKRDRGNNNNRSNQSFQNNKREPKKDINNAPLYGRIDK
ncbi:MAG: hypothetical protein BGN88_12475 [Clostridiales bacterium 43-6]|nr:MAG: hypothetical protein BGN88_12475 [Clostridiales bacterium 43-6]